MGEVLVERWGEIGKGEGMTNNRGEGTAILYALRWAYNEHYREIATPEHREVLLRSDSLLFINMMTGIWGCKQASLVPIVARLHKAKDYLNIRWEWLPRTWNHRADELSRRPYVTIEEAAT